MKRYHVTKQRPIFGLPTPSSDRSWRFSATQKTDVYDAIFNAGSDGLEAKEISAKSGVNLDRVRFYVSDLRRAGVIAVKGDPSVITPTMNADEAAFAAMLGLENALIARARELGAAGVSDKMNRGFVRYQKVKAMALTPPDPSNSPATQDAVRMQAKVALRQCLLDLVKLVY